MTNYYAGIGSRKTPPDILNIMELIGIELARKGFVLRSGGAAGADSAFERGCDSVRGKKEIFLPWAKFNNHEGIVGPSPEAFKIAAKFHPAWNRCSRYARILHARNSHQVLGYDLKTPSKFIICWHQGTGGTMQAVRIANHYKIPVFNLNEMKLSPEKAAVPTFIERIIMEMDD